MLSTTNNKLTSLLFLISSFWIATGMLWDGDGDMRLVPIVLSLVITSVLVSRFHIIKNNFKNNFWIKLLAINGLFGLIAYEIYGFNSRELRATLVIFLLFLTTPRNLYTKSAMQWFLFVSSLSCALYGYYYQHVENLLRGYWPINAVPFATISGLILLSSVSLLLTTFKNKNYYIITFSIFFSVLALLFSESRGPIISSLIVFSMIVLYYSYKKSKLFALCMFLAIIISMLFASKLAVVEKRIHATNYEYSLIKRGIYDSSLGVRLQMFDIAIELWKVRPMLGYGTNVEKEFGRLESEGVINDNVHRLISMTFHNGYLDKFVLYGVFGGGIFLIFLIYPIWKARCYGVEEGSTLLWAPALFISICNLSDAPFINAQAAIYYMFIIGSVIMILSNEKEIV